MFAKEVWLCQKEVTYLGYIPGMGGTVHSPRLEKKQFSTFPSPRPGVKLMSSWVQQDSADFGYQDLQRLQNLSMRPLGGRRGP